MILLRLPPTRELPPEVHRTHRSAFVAEVNRSSSQRRRRNSPWQRSRVVVPFACLGLALALVIPSIGVGEILRLVGLKRTPPYVTLEHDWRDAIARGAMTDPATKFTNLAPNVLRRRLDAASELYGFRVVSIEFLQPKGLAPLVIIATPHAAKFARAVPYLMRQIDPKTTGDEGSGWSFEGIFLKALDERGKPFLVVDNHWRGNDAGGSQWARSDDLLPYPHA